jgi:hypothetical protein
MISKESFSNSTYEDQIRLAERELASFIGAVTELFGPEQARLSAEDWLVESEQMDSPPRSEARDWRSVTIAASARLASRIGAARHSEKMSLALLIPRYRQYQSPIVRIPSFCSDDSRRPN